MTTVIRQGVSKYQDRKVYDKEIVKYVGFENYCRLRKAAPSLYDDFVECDTVSCIPSEVEALTLEHSPHSIKRQLVCAIATGTTTEVTENLCLPSPRKQPVFLDPPLATAWWIVWLFIIILIIVLVVINLGLVHTIFKQRGFTLQPELVINQPIPGLGL